MSRRAPAPQLYSFYRDGWSLQKKQKLESIVLPEKSRCFECDKVKTTAVAFSEKQLSSLRNGLASGQVSADTTKGWIKCRNCVGIQPNEMQCVQCEKVKALDDFARTQRRTPDAARCKSCSAEVINCVALGDEKRHGDGAEDSGEDESVESRSNAYGSTVYDDEDLDSDSGVPLPEDLTAENLNVLNISRGNTTQYTASKVSTSASMAGSTTGPSQASTAGIKGWQMMSRMDGKENVGLNRFTAYDAQGNAHIKAVSSTSGSVSDDSDETTTYAARVAKERAGKFAKIPAVKRPVPVPKTDGGRNVTYESDSDDEEEDDEDNYFVI